MGVLPAERELLISLHPVGSPTLIAPGDRLVGFGPIIAIVFVFSNIYNLFWVKPNAELIESSAQLSLIEFYQVRNSFRQTFAQIVGGAALLFGLYFTARTLHTAQEGQITDRFTRAVNQLGEQGPEKLAIRLGGIYALERIAEDSLRDRQPITEIMAAYVRAHAPWKEEPYSPDEISLSKTQPAPNNQLSPKLAIDIQAVLTVIQRYPSSIMFYSFDLSNTDLRGAHLRGAGLRRANLQSAHLEGAWLREAHLDEAWLREAHIEGAHLEQAHLTRADLEGAHLNNAMLWRTNLKGAKNLTVEQLSTVETLYEAYLDPPLLDQIQQQYPHLLEKPKN